MWFSVPGTLARNPTLLTVTYFHGRRKYVYSLTQKPWFAQGRPPLHCLFCPLSCWLTAFSGINMLAWMAEYNTSDLLGGYKCSPNGRTITTFGRGSATVNVAPQERGRKGAGKGFDGRQAATLRVACPLADWMGTCKESNQTQCRYKH